MPYAQCVEVTGSHVGLVFNRKAYRAIAETLAEPRHIGAERRIGPRAPRPRPQLAAAASSSTSSGWLAIIGP